MQRKGNPHALLVRIQTDAATLENGMEVSQKVKPPYDPEIATLDIYSKNVMIKRSIDQEITLQIHMHPLEHLNILNNTTSFKRVARQQYMISQDFNSPF